MSPHAKTTAQKCGALWEEYMFRASCRRSFAAALIRGAAQYASEMVRQLETYSKGEIRGTVQFLWAKRLNCTDIHRQILAVCGSNAISRPAIVKWCQQFDKAAQTWIMVFGQEGHQHRPQTTMSKESRKWFAAIAERLSRKLVRQMRI